MLGLPYKPLLSRDKIHKVNLPVMFGALNRFISRLDAEPLPNNQPQNANDTSFGFQVLRNTNPDLQIEPWFDFIIGLNGHYIVREPSYYRLTAC